MRDGIAASIDERNKLPVRSTPHRIDRTVGDNEVARTVIVYVVRSRSTVLLAPAPGWYARGGALHT